MLNQPDKPEQPDRPDQPDQPDQPNLLDQPDLLDRPDKPGLQDKADRQDPQDQQDLHKLTSLQLCFPIHVFTHINKSLHPCLGKGYTQRRFPSQYSAHIWACFFLLFFNSDMVVALILAISRISVISAISAVLVFFAFQDCDLSKIKIFTKKHFHMEINILMSGKGK